MEKGDNMPSTKSKLTFEFHFTSSDGAPRSGRLQVDQPEGMPANYDQRVARFLAHGLASQGGSLDYVHRIDSTAIAIDLPVVQPSDRQHQQEGVAKPLEDHEEVVTVQEVSTEVHRIRAVSRRSHHRQHTFRYFPRPGTSSVG